MAVMHINDQVKISFDGDRILLSRAFSEMREGKDVFYDLVVHSQRPLNKDGIDLARKIQTVWMEGAQSLWRFFPEAHLKKLEISSNEAAKAVGELPDEVALMDPVSCLQPLYNDLFKENPLKGRVAKEVPNIPLTKRIRKAWKFCDYAISIGSNGVSCVRNSLEVFGLSIRVMAVAGGILSSLGAIVSFVCSGYELARSFFSRNIELAV